MTNKIYIRGLNGEPVEAVLIRRVRLKKGFSNLGLVQTGAGHFSVTELTTGCAIGYWHYTEEDAIEAAKEKLSDKTIESFKAGIADVRARFGELPQVGAE